MPDDEAVPSMADLFPEVEEAASPFGAGEEQSSLADAVRGRTILLTGAGGSLGTVLARRLAAAPVERLLLLDTSEQGLVRLRERLGSGPANVQGEPPGKESAVSTRPAIDYLLADLRVPADRTRALRREPSIVIHAAAYKHVPFLEERPIAAVQNNLLATVDWLRACQSQSAVEQFVLVSTDKAVRPAGVMGATKAAAEHVLRDATAALDAKIARLCNVFGSRGSVVPRFCRRLREGQFLPVTHPEMERWFVSAEAAARAVLQTLRHEPGTYVPRRCERIRIEALARRLVQWHRPSASHETWIRHVGRRAGERLRESLLAPMEQPGDPVDGGLLRAQAVEHTIQPEFVAQCLERLRRHCQMGNAEVVNAYLHSVAALTAPPVPRSGGDGRLDQGGEGSSACTVQGRSS